MHTSLGIDQLRSVSNMHTPKFLPVGNHQANLIHTSLHCYRVEQNEGQLRKVVSTSVKQQLLSLGKISTLGLL
jgi:hypothetical protein